ncbi:MFS transporter [Chromobacterium haemolyticum]|nr:MFS transporter [Chromobacterium haemolyticum]
MRRENAAMPATLDVDRFIDQNRLGPFHAVLLTLCFLVMFADGYDLAALSYIAPALMEQWGLSKPQLGQALSAALFGLAGGAMLGGPLADRLGRKPAVIASTLLFGVGSLLTAAADSLSTLTVYRLLTGIGLGAALPNTITLLSEYSPARRRALLVSSMLCGFPLGAGAGGLCAGWLIPSYGWRAPLWLGGVFPLLLALALYRWLPESVRYLVARRRSVADIRQRLRRLAATPELERAAAFRLGGPSEDAPRDGLRAVLSRPLAAGTLLLWLSCFMSMLIYYLVVNWMPLLLKEAGLSLSRFAWISALFPLGGGVGSILLGWWMGRAEPHRLLAANFVASGMLAWAIGATVAQGEQGGQLGLLVFCMGFASGGGQSALASLSAAFYPTHCRASGVGGMYGVGRGGAIFGVLAGAELMRQQARPDWIFNALLLPAIIIAISLLLKRRRYAPSLTREI